MLTETIRELMEIKMTKEVTSEQVLAWARRMEVKKDQESNT